MSKKRKPKHRQPFYRKARQLWYVQLNGKQINLGPDKDAAPQHMREEILKAKLILADPSWGTRIDAAEAHGYFRGQIEFLLDFAGVVGMEKDVPVTSWAADVHVALQREVDDYSAKAQWMFGTSGLNTADLPGKWFLWQRALLVCGDYLSSKGSNHSFLTDAVGSWSSWKRYLRGETSGPSPRRRYLKVLWDRLDATAPISPQLHQIITSRPTLEPREAVVKHGKVISYCAEREIRRIGNEDKVYLLRRHQMNGAHVELFSYALNLELNNASRIAGLLPLKLQPYLAVAGSEYEPHFVLLYERLGDSIKFFVLSQDGKFSINAMNSSVQAHPDVEAVLRGTMEFREAGDRLARLCPRKEIDAILDTLAQCLAQLQTDSGVPAQTT